MLPDPTDCASLSSSGTPADRVEFETLISDVSARLVAASPDEVEPVIVDTLERVRVFFQADRCALLNISAESRSGTTPASCARNSPRSASAACWNCSRWPRTAR